MGNHTKAILVDNSEVPLSTRLDNGQTVEVVTDPEVFPRPEWLEFVGTAKARTAIRHYIKSLQQEDTVALGHQILERALNARGSNVDAVSPEAFDAYLNDNQLKSIEDLYRDLSLGNVLANIVAAKLVPDADSQPGHSKTTEALTIAGSEGSAVTFGACCHPVPGDAIMGYISAGKGVVVHRIQCRNVREFRKHPDRCLNVAWAAITHSMFPVELRIVTLNVPGVLASISASIGEAGSNIEKVEQPETNPETATLMFTISVDDRDHMARVMRRLKRNRNVLKISRTNA